MSITYARFLCVLLLGVSSLQAQQLPSSPSLNALDLADCTIKQAEAFSGSWKKLEWFKFKRIDAHQAFMGAAAAGVISAGCVFSALVDCYECIGMDYGLAGLASLAIPTAVYFALESSSTMACYRDAVSKFSDVVKQLENDNFYNGLVPEDSAAGYILAHFGIEAGVVNAIKHYQFLYQQLLNVQESIKEASQTRDSELEYQCKMLDRSVQLISSQLVKKLASLYERQKTEFNKQLSEQKQQEKDVAAKIEKQKNDISAALVAAKDKQAAINAGTFSYNVNKKVNA